MDLFDDLYLFVGGRCAYFGSMKSAREWFGFIVGYVILFDVNVVEYFIDFVSIDVMLVEMIMVMEKCVVSIVVAMKSSSSRFVDASADVGK